MSNVKVGWWVIWAIAIVGAILWWQESSSLAISGNAGLLNSIGRLAGTVGLGWFAVTLVLNTRWKWVEEWFGGLPKMFGTHHWLGGVSFMLLLAHPILLAAGRMYTSVEYAARLFLPMADWRVTAGLAGLIVMQVALIATFFMRLAYQNWKFLHQWLGLAFVLGGLHGIMLSFGHHAPTGLVVYEVAAMVVGLIAFGYRTILGFWLVPKFTYRVAEVSKLSADTVEIKLEPVGRRVKYQPGQFVSVSFLDDKVGREAHPFSITSVGETIELGVKVAGDFTRRLVDNLSVGVLARLERPYGKFAERQSAGFEQVWIAGGIGVTPFVSMARAIKPGDGPIKLWYSVANQADLAYQDVFEQVATAQPNFSWQAQISKRDGRLRLETILQNTDAEWTEFWICGPTKMMDDFEAGLLAAGVGSAHIHTERFEL